MVNLSLYEFIEANREEIIRRCREKVAKRSAPVPTEAEIEHGVPLFLDQLVEELRQGPSKTHEIARSAMAHGHDLLLQAFTIGQVVHDNGDVCQSITDLAVELAAPISADDFRTLNRCLDNAIAGAVTQYAHEPDVTRSGDSDELRTLTIPRSPRARCSRRGMLEWEAALGPWSSAASWPSALLSSSVRLSIARPSSSPTPSLDEHTLAHETRSVAFYFVSA